MRILGATVRELQASGGRAAVAALDAGGALASLAWVDGVPALAREVAREAAGEPFLLAVDVSVAADPRGGRPRRVDGWLLRRLGVRTQGRGDAPGSNGSELLAALATAGHPCLPYPDRDRRRSGLAEIHPEAVLKALLWEVSQAAASSQLPDREEVLRAIEPPVYRGPRLAKAAWPRRFAAVEEALRALDGIDGYDLRLVREELSRSVTIDGIERAAAALDAALLAATARRYLEETERCAFVGERDMGYTILPADGFLRRVVLREPRPSAERGGLFPRASLRDRLDAHADVRPMELLDLPGRAPHLEAVFRAAPLYEFDNLDEMLWWKHCRHLDGPDVPQDGLREMVVRLEPSGAGDGTPLRLARSRHKTLSFRFEPPQSWRARLAPRDGKTYPFRVLRAVYEVR